MLVEISSDTSKRYTVPVLRYEISDDDSEDFAMPKIVGMDTIVISFFDEPSFSYSYEDENGFVEEDAPQTSIYSYDDDVTVTFLGNEISLFGANDPNSTTFIDLGINRDVFADGTTLDSLWAHVTIDNDTQNPNYLGSFLWAIDADLEVNNQQEFEGLLSANPITETIAIPAEVPYGPNKSDWLVSALASSGVEPEEVQIDGETSTHQITNLDVGALVFKDGSDTVVNVNSGEIRSGYQELAFTHVELKDQDYDHGIDISDVIAQLRVIVGLDSLSGMQKIAADIDNDGEVSISDVIANLRHIVGLDTVTQCSLVDTNNQRVTSLNSSTISELTLVQHGDVDLSATFGDLI